MSQLSRLGWVSIRATLVRLIPRRAASLERAELAFGEGRLAEAAALFRAVAQDSDAAQCSDAVRARAPPPGGLRSLGPAQALP